MDEKEHLSVPVLTQSEEEEAEEEKYRLELNYLEWIVVVNLSSSGDPEAVSDIVSKTQLDPDELENVLEGLRLRGVISRVGANGASAEEDNDEIFDETDFARITGRPVNGYAAEENALSTAEQAEEEEGSEVESIEMTLPAREKTAAPATEKAPQEGDDKEGVSGETVASSDSDAGETQEGPPKVEVPEEARPEEAAVFQFTEGVARTQVEVESETAQDKRERPEKEDKQDEAVLDAEGLSRYLQSLKDKHYYDMLGVSPSAERVEIRGAYYDLVSRFHPDQNRNVEDKKVQEILADVFGILTKAYETLYRKKERLKYDRTIPKVTGAQESEEDEALAMLFDESSAYLPAAKKDSKPAGWSFYEAAVEAFQAGDYNAADLNFKLAAGMEPGRAEYVEGLEKTREIINKSRLTELKREGKWQEDQRRYHEAIACFSQAVDLDPTDPDLRYALARIRFLKTMDRIRAEEDISWAISLDPDHVEGLLLLGRIQAWKGNFEAAIEAFKKVLAIQPGHKKAHQALELFASH